MSSETETNQKNEGANKGYTARTLAEALLALPDPDQPMIAETSWTVDSACRSCSSYQHYNVPLTDLIIGKDGIEIDEGEPTYCSSRGCDCAGKHELDGDLYCTGCHKHLTTDHKAVKEQEVREAARLLAYRQKQLNELDGSAEQAEKPLSVTSLERWLADEDD